MAGVGGAHNRGSRTRDPPEMAPGVAPGPIQGRSAGRLAARSGWKVDRDRAVDLVPLGDDGAQDPVEEAGHAAAI